ncbi:MAG: YggT family protein [Acidihalobacter sp.]|uniref:YggT family protein n=1 Tax=Acidihalobacter sp. TaxID=1872108 RepID=UPI00307DC255
MNAGTQIGLLLINALFSFYIVIVMLRLLFALVRADFYNPISQFVVTLTNPPLRPLRRIIPPVGRVDSASILLLLVLQLAEIYLISVLQGFVPPPLAAFIFSIRELLILLVYIYIGAIIIQALMSWVAAAGSGYNPIMGLLDSLTRPILAPIRRVIPLIGMIDLSPLVALLALQAALILLRSVFGG